MNGHGKSEHLIDIRNTYPDFTGIVESVRSLTSGESSDMGLTLSMTGQVRDRVDCFKRKWGRVWYGIQNTPQGAVLLLAGLHLRSVCWDCAGASLETERFEGQALCSGPGVRMCGRVQWRS